MLYKRVMKENNLTVLMFHGLRREVPIYSKYRGYSSYILLENDFENCISWCYNNAKIVTLENINDYLNGEAKEPGILITFDDGLHSLVEIGCPILKRYDASAVVFTTTGWIDAGIEPAIFDLERQIWFLQPTQFSFQRDDICFNSRVVDVKSIPKVIDNFWKFCFKNRISPVSIRQFEFQFDGKIIENQFDKSNVHDWAPASWEDLRNSVRNGTLEIGTHGVTHTPWTWMSSEEMKLEANQSILRVEQEIGIRPVSFSFPHGAIDRLALNVANEYFHYCFTSESQKVGVDTNLSNGIPRFNVYSGNIKSELSFPKLTRIRRSIVNRFSFLYK